MKKLLAASLLLASGSAFADPLSSVDAVPSHDAPTKEQQIQDKKDDWTSGFHGMVGLAVINTPTWAGVDDQETIGAPLINVHWKDTVYFEYNKLGGWLFKNDDKTFRVGLVVRSRKGCDKGDCNLVGHEVDAYGIAGVRAKWRNGRFSIDASVMGASESDSGGEGEFIAKYTFLANKQMTLTAMAKFEMLSEDAVGYLYYNTVEDGPKPDSAVNASLGLVGTYNINKDWTLIGAVLATSLDDSIADAPGVTEDSTTTALLGATYRF
ncbi:MipA/OmpV family protein [Colwelliaceae bacterium BS250]